MAEGEGLEPTKPKPPVFYCGGVSNTVRDLALYNAALMGRTLG